MEIPRENVEKENPGSRISHPDEGKSKDRKAESGQDATRRAPSQGTPAEERSDKAKQVPGDSLGAGGQAGVKV